MIVFSLSEHKKTTLFFFVLFFSCHHIKTLRSGLYFWTDLTSQPVTQTERRLEAPPSALPAGPGQRLLFRMKTWWAGQWSGLKPSIGSTALMERISSRCCDHLNVSRHFVLNIFWKIKRLGLLGKSQGFTLQISQGLQRKLVLGSRIRLTRTSLTSDTPSHSGKACPNFWSACLYAPQGTWCSSPFPQQHHQCTQLCTKCV